MTQPYPHTPNDPGQPQPPPVHTPRPQRIHEPIPVEPVHPELPREPGPSPEPAIEPPQRSRASATSWQRCSPRGKASPCEGGSITILRRCGEGTPLAPLFRSQRLLRSKGDRPRWATQSR